MPRHYGLINCVIINNRFRIGLNEWGRRGAFLAIPIFTVVVVNNHSFFCISEGKGDSKLSPFLTVSFHYFHHFFFRTHKKRRPVRFTIPRLIDARFPPFPGFLVGLLRDANSGDCQHQQPSTVRILLRSATGEAANANDR